MALPEQIVERLSHEPVRTPGWSSRLLMFSGTIFFISLALYIGIVFGYKPYLEKEVANLDGQIKSFGQKIPPEEQSRLVSFYSQISNIQGVFRGHVASSKFFEWLEKNTETNIYYTRMNLLSFSGQVSLAGVSKTVEDFSKQLVVFQNSPLVQRVAVNSFSNVPANNMWQFDMTLYLTNGALSQSASQQ